MGKNSVTRKVSEEQILLRLHLKELGFDSLYEWEFEPTRHWRGDIVVHSHKLIIEIDGGQFSGGHRTGFISKKVRERARRRGTIPQTPQEEDFDKVNTATMLGWRVLHFTPQQVSDGRAKAFIQGCF
jgi:very-short-patch-repair endonuclease